MYEVYRVLETEYKSLFLKRVNYDQYSQLIISYYGFIKTIFILSSIRNDR